MNLLVLVPALLCALFVVLLVLWGRDDYWPLNIGPGSERTSSVRASLVTRAFRGSLPEVSTRMGTSPAGRKV
jgi:hypothetical protein